MLFGREDFKSCKCPHCNLSRTLDGLNWQNLNDSLKQGSLFTVECIQAEIDNYRLAHNLEQTK